MTPDPTPTPDFSPEAIAELRSKWERYADRLREGDGGGSLVGAAYIIANTAVADIPTLLAALEASERERERLRTVAEAAALVLDTTDVDTDEAVELETLLAALAPSTPPDLREDA